MTTIPPARWRMEKRPLAGFGIAVFLLLSIGFVSYRTICELADANARVIRSHRILEHLFELSLDFDDIESAARGFVTTGDPSYALAFQSGEKRLGSTLKELQALTSGDWDQSQRLDRLEPLIEHRLSLAQRIIRLRRSAGNQALARMIESGTGDEIVPEIRAGIKAMETAQNAVLADLDLQAQRSAGRTTAALGAGCILVLLVFSAAAFINHRDMTRLRKSDQALSNSRTSLQDFLDYANDLIYSISPDGRFLYVNRKWVETLGYTEDELPKLSSLDIIHPDHRSQARSVHEKLLKGETVDQFETVFVTKKARSVVVSGSMNSRLESGAVVAIRSIFRDITERKQAEEALRRSNEVLLHSVRELEQRTDEITRLSEMVDLLQSCRTVEEAYAVISRSVPLILPAATGSLGIISDSKNLVEIVSAWEDASQGERVFSPDDCWALRRGRIHVANGQQMVPSCSHLGESKPENYMCLPLVAQGEAFGLLHLQYLPREGGQGAQSRTSEAYVRLASTMAESMALALANLRLREVLSHQSVRDSLTGLFNRRYMEESLERELRRAARSGRPLGVLMMDLDNFKKFNDTYGHDAGDTLLREFGAILRTGIRGGDISCRYGGEEFALILPEATPESTLFRAEQLRENVKHLRVQYDHHDLGIVTVSVGVAAFPKHGATSESLLKAADRALYSAKALGRDRVVMAEVNAMDGEVQSSEPASSCRR